MFFSSLIAAALVAQVGQVSPDVQRPNEQGRADVEALPPGSYNLIKIRVPGGQVLGLVVGRQGEGEDIFVSLEDITDPNNGPVYSAAYGTLNTSGGGWIDIGLAFDRPMVGAWNAPSVVVDLTTTGTNPGEPGYGVPDGDINGADLSFFVENWRSAASPPPGVRVIRRGD